MYQNLPEHLAPAARAELRKSIVDLKQKKAITLNSYKSGAGARKEGGRLAGVEIPFFKNLAHGEAALDPLTGSTSFGRMIPQNLDKMFVGVAFGGFTVEWEHFHQTDANRGNLPMGKEQQRDAVMETYLLHQNWYRIGDGSGVLAVATTAGGSGTRTFAYDATARNRSKGSIRLAVSYNTAAGKRILYQSVDPATDTVNAEFYITSKPNATQAVCVMVSGSVAVGDVIVKKGHYKRVAYGHGTHFSNGNRWYQGVDTTNYDFLKCRYVDGGGAGITPTMITTAKTANKTRGNDAEAGKKKVAHLTPSNYQELAAFGYTLRTYNAEKGEADTSFGLPTTYQDEDWIFIQDADFEEAFIDVRDKRSYFEYRQQELQEISPGAQQYVGTEMFGSTEKFQNWGESFNFVWDARGDDGKGQGGQPNSSVYIGNLAMPAVTQVAEGISQV
ncbi:MAG TPA: hypothetical protein VIL74_09015 [Pyrinomonadaceae bacterium]|jgi:hypothetical protein